jgi:hypothetical protein
LHAVHADIVGASTASAPSPAIVLIEAVADRLSCLAVTFRSNAVLRLRFAEVVLDNSLFAGPATISFAEDAFRRQTMSEGPQPTLFDEGSLADRRHPRPRLLSLRRVDAGQIVVADVDLSACLFHGAHNLDRLRIEGPPPFAWAPRAWRVRIGRRWFLVWRQWTRRQTLAEEHCYWQEKPQALSESRSRLLRPTWHPPECGAPDWVAERTRQPVHQLSADRVAELYRALRKAQEDNKNAPGAADFYYGEMEMRRRSASTSPGEQVILYLYWAASGYGLKSIRALGWLVLALVCGAIVLQFAGFDRSPHSIWTSLLYGAESALSIQNDSIKVSAWGRVIRIALRVLGPLFLGLALLSIRNRVKR